MVSNWIETLLRWFHVVAGIAWIGHLYFFNFVNSQVAKTYDADSKKKVVPELMPRALYWFRWGAAYTWVTGFLLLGLVIYMQKSLMLLPNSTLSAGAVTGIGIGVLLVAFFIYDVLWKSPLGKNEMAGTAVSFVLVAALAYGLSMVMSGRAMFIHIGSIFGTIMAMNVWMRIWPAQRKIIAGIKGTGPAPDAAVPAMATLRSKHNTYMSVPLVFFMLSQHFSLVFTSAHPYLWAVAFVAVGWALTKFLYVKSAQPAPASF